MMWPVAFLQKECSKELGQTIVVENVAGGGGLIGATKMARANPDG
jgi:tripartite-type tricarboxylate transporter receptor subunit TctC